MTSLELTSSGTADFGEGDAYFIGNATTLIRFGGLTILTDPAFLHKGEHVYLGHGVELNPDWMFDIQVKRIHEHKRQHLNVLHIVALYHRLKQNPGLSIPQRAFVFGGKAAPGYFIA
jgi:Carbohydrate phosphorylase